MTWVLTGVALLMATVAVWMFAMHAARQKRATAEVDRMPDRPVPFGYRTAWLAIRTSDTIRVLEALDLTELSRASWSGGIAATYDEAMSESHVFVSPPVAGWTLVIGVVLPQPASAVYHDRAGQLLAGLAGEFRDVQYYFNYPPLDLYGWARWKEGRLLRAFAMGGEGILWDAGKLTEGEQRAGLRLPVTGKDGRKSAWQEHYTYPSEDAVIGLAAHWSLDPTAIDRSQAVAGLGYLGRAPAHWRLKRIPAARRALGI
jgi:hypothetical protein